MLQLLYSQTLSFVSDIIIIIIIPAHQISIFGDYSPKWQV